MIDKRKWLEQIRVDRTRTMPILTFPAIQPLGVSVRELVTTPGLQARAMKYLADRYPTSAALSMMDLSVEAEAFGASIRYFDMDIPTVVGSIVNSAQDALRLPVPAVGAGRTGKYIEGVGLAKAMINDRPVFAGVIGPFSLSARLMDMTEIMISCYLDPEIVHTTIAKAAQFIENYILAFKKAGADGIIIAEPAAGLLSPQLCEEFSSHYIRHIREAVVDDGFVIIYHNCGNTVPLLPSILGIGADAYHFGNAVDMETILDNMPPDIIVMGNLSPSDVFRKSTPEMVRKETTTLLERCVHHRNFCISSGCDIPPLTRLENIDAYFDAVSHFAFDHR